MLVCSLPINGSMKLSLVAAAALTALSVGCSAAPADDSADDSAEAVTNTPWVAVPDATGPSALNTKFDQLYSQAVNWQPIADKAYAEVGYDTPPCATFQSFALEKLVGVQFPSNHAATIHVSKVPSLPVNGQQPHTFTSVNGTYQIRYNTSGLSTYLMQEKGFEIVWDTASLLPGDIVFVLPADYGSGAKSFELHPAHTYMFHGWVDAEHVDAWVVDNEADGYCAPDEDPKDRTFIAYCDADSEPLLCCRGKDYHQYRRSVGVSAAEPKGAATPGEIDQRMWFALRAPN